LPDADDMKHAAGNPSLAQDFATSRLQPYLDRRGECAIEAGWSQVAKSSGETWLRRNLGRNTGTAGRLPVKLELPDEKAGAGQAFAAGAWESRCYARRREAARRLNFAW
jgi:hypothetical protein